MRCRAFRKFLKNLQSKTLSFNEFEVHFHDPIHSSVILFQYLTVTDFGSNFVFFLKHFAQCLMTSLVTTFSMFFKEKLSFAFKAQICTFFYSFSAMVSNNIWRFKDWWCPNTTPYHTILFGFNDLAINCIIYIAYVAQEQINFRVRFTYFFFIKFDCEFLVSTWYKLYNLLVGVAEYIIIWPTEKWVIISILQLDQMTLTLCWLIDFFFWLPPRLFHLFQLNLHLSKLRILSLEAFHFFKVFTVVLTKKKNTSFITYFCHILI